MHILQKLMPISDLILLNPFYLFRLLFTHIAKNLK